MIFYYFQFVYSLIFAKFAIINITYETYYN